MSQPLRVFRPLGCALLIFGFWLVPLYAQTSQDIVGTVRDQTGALIPGVTVTARHLGTNESREAVTNDTGDYRIIRLGRVGRYEIRAEMPGFKMAVVPDVLLTTGQTLRVDLVLEVGEVTDSVTVEGRVPLVRSETSSLEVVVQNREILELPLYGRDFLALTGLTAGVSTKAPAGAGYQLHNLVVGGARARDNEYRIDGIRAMASHNADITVKPPLDSIQEFQLIRHQYSAEYGRAMGAIVEVRTKSGTNDFHGSVYEFARRGNWSAVPYFAASKPRFTQDDFGGSIGGPVWLPGLYNGRNRTFFFYNFEKFRSPSDIVMRNYVLTEAERQGDFSQSIWGQPVDPLTGQPFDGGRVPAGRFSPAALNMLDILPGPNQPLDGTFNSNVNLPNDTETPKHVFRVDHAFSDRHSLFSSVMWNRQSRIVAPALDCGTGCNRASDLDEDFDDVNLVVGYTWSLSPAVIWQARAGYSYHKQGWEQIDRSQNFAKEWGFAFHPPDDRPDLHGVPRINVAGFGSYFGLWATPFNHRLEYLYHLSNTVSVIKGDHYIKLGADIIEDRLRGSGACGSTGQYWFGSNADGTLNRAADFLMGIYNFAGFQFTPQWSKAKRLQTSYFVQDDWKLSPRLTLNLGLRHDYFAPYESMTGRIARFDLHRDEVIYPEKARSQMTPDQLDALEFPFRFEGSARSYPEAAKGNFSPRLGLAFRPFGGNDTVVRAGYGLFYGSPQGFAVVRNWKVAPWQAWLNFGDFVGPGRLMFVDQKIPEVETVQYLTPGDIRMPEEGFKNAYVQHWNLTIQRALGGDVAVELGYAGSRGVHLEFEHRGQKFAHLYGFQDYFMGAQLRISSSGHDSKYHALQTTLQKRYSRGLTFRANYTWSKLMNDTPELFDTGSASDPLIEKRTEWSRGQADLTHNFNLSGIYELPFGRGQAWGAAWSRGLDAVLGGWKLNFLMNAHSGAPMNVLWGPTFRPDLVPGSKASLDNPTRDRWIDPGVFQRPSCFPCQGNVGRNIVNGPGFFDTDLGVSKIFRIPGTENHTLEVRGELFNAFNHPNLFRAATDVSQPGSERLTGAFPMRRVQLGLRYAF